MRNDAFGRPGGMVGTRGGTVCALGSKISQPYVYMTVFPIFRYQSSVTYFGDTLYIIQNVKYEGNSFVSGRVPFGAQE